MKKVLLNVQEQKLIRQLQQEASLPAFSESLHQRIMAKVRTGDADNAEPLPFVMPPPHHGRWLALAASIAIAAMAGVWGFSHYQQKTAEQIVKMQTRQEVITSMSMPVTMDILAQTNTHLNQRLQQARYAYLDRDAQRLGNFIANQLEMFPVLPAGPAETPQPKP